MARRQAAAGRGCAAGLKQNRPVEKNPENDRKKVDVFGKKRNNSLFSGVFSPFSPLFYGGCDVDHRRSIAHKGEDLIFTPSL